MTRWILVTGAREYPDEETISNVLTPIFTGDCVLIHGDARGVDTIAKLLAQKAGILDIPHPYIRALGKAGGQVRNQQMIDFCKKMLEICPEDTVECYSFPLLPINPKSGTRDCMTRINKAGFQHQSFPCSSELGVD